MRMHVDDAGIAQSHVMHNPQYHSSAPALNQEGQLSVI